MKHAHKFFLLLLAACATSTGAMAQIGYSDALMYSQTQFGGTARFQGFAGAGSSLGGDLSSASINPAGLGFNRRSEFSLSAALGVNTYETGYLGNTTRENRLNVNLPSFGVVFSRPKNGLSGNYGGSFAISVNRLQNFQGAVAYEGVNNQNQITDFFLQQADGIPWDDFEQQGIGGQLDLLGLAYYTYQINPDIIEDPGTRDSYFSIMPLPSQFPTTQRQSITTSGAQYQWDFSYGGNYDDTFYYGFGIGVQTLRYSREREYTESINQQNNVFNELVLVDFLEQNGVGINLKGGVIYRAADRLRLGVSAVSPTWYRVTEAYSEEMFVDYNNFEFFTGIDEQGNEQFTVLNNEAAEAFYENITFSMRTPWRLNVGASYFFNKNGFISADVEYVDYTTAQLNNPRIELDGADAGFDFDFDNEVIGQEAASAVNIRVGGEYRVRDFRFRAGYAQYGDPFETDDVSGTVRRFVTAGAGMRKKDFYVDLALVNGLSDRTYKPYVLFDGNRDVSPRADASVNNFRMVLSFGSFF